MRPSWHEDDRSALASVWRAEGFGVRTNLGEMLGWVATFFGLVHLAFGVMYLSL